MRHTAGSQSGPDDSCSFSDFAVIYRTNAQAKAVEEAFLASGIPYQVIGRKSSLQSREIAEVVSYLRSLAGTDLDVSLRHSRESGNPVSSKSSGCRIKSGMTDKIDSDENETVLLTEADFFDPRANAVTLSTLHTAKGLEFRVVFITGVEEGLVPLTVTRDDVDIEEERRLFYVGMTRAKNELLFLHARNRFLYGQRTAPSPSPFLAEIPGSLIDTIVIPDRIKKQKDPDRQMGLF
jgi:superfamily I DNA/RNA helicase